MTTKQSGDSHPKQRKGASVRPKKKGKQSVTDAARADVPDEPEDDEQPVTDDTEGERKRDSE